MMGTTSEKFDLGFWTLNLRICKAFILTASVRCLPARFTLLIEVERVSTTTMHFQFTTSLSRPFPQHRPLFINCRNVHVRNLDWIKKREHIFTVTHCTGRLWLLLNAHGLYIVISLEHLFLFWNGNIFQLHQLVNAIVAVSVKLGSPHLSLSLQSLHTIFLSFESVNFEPFGLS
jgi:hypothetical protein